VKSLGEMETFIPAADRQRGARLAEQIKADPALAGKPSTPTPRMAAALSRPAPKPSAAPAAKPAVAAAAPAPKAAPAIPSAAGGRWRAQLGAYGSPAAAQAQWASLSKRIGGIAGLQPSYEKAGPLVRLRVGPLASRGDAEKVCASAKAAGQACFPVAP
jgi:cell division septation protein DedD